MENDYYAGALGNLDDLDKVLFERALGQWTERPQLGDGYNKRVLKLYDALIWTRVENIKDELKVIKSSIKNRNEARKNTSGFIKSLTPETNNDLTSKLNAVNEDINSWKYVGKIYRIIDCRKSQVEYHQLIASWTDTPEAFKQFNHLCKKPRYSFLIADTGKDWAFDVNKYRNHTKNRHCYTEHESEIIFPMDKQYVVDLFYGTLEEFYKYIGTRRP